MGIGGMMYIPSFMTIGKGLEATYGFASEIEGGVMFVMLMGGIYEL
jgi:hypothetical protein